MIIFPWNLPDSAIVAMLTARRVADRAPRALLGVSEVVARGEEVAIA